MDTVYVIIGIVVILLLLLIIYKLFSAGSVYTLNISVNWPEVGATTAIEGWTENGTVNIHPTKTEIKFENEQSIWQILLAAVKDAVGRFCEVPTIDFDTEGRPEIPLFNPQAHTVEMPAVNYNPEYNPFKTTNKTPSAGGGDGKIYGSRVSQSYDVQKDWKQLYEVAQGERQVERLFQNSPAEESAAPDFLADKSPAHYQYKGRYVMTAVRSGLMIIDQHRADMRIRYENYLQQLSQQQSRTQQLLFPEVAQFAPSEIPLLTQVLPVLTKVGFDLSDLGGGSVAIAGVPAGLDGLDPVALVKGLVNDVKEMGSSVVEEQLNAALAQSLARQAAIPQGQVLDNEEMERLVNQLFACENVNYTPDGKAILAILPQHDIEQLLG